MEKLQPSSIPLFDPYDIILGSGQRTWQFSSRQARPALMIWRAAMRPVVLVKERSYHPKSAEFPIHVSKKTNLYVVLKG
jgi:hypothetical protein